MPEIKKRIVIASVLKPLNDTRMTEKIACSLADDPTLKVHVIGFPSAIPADARLEFHTFPAFNRLSFSRWIASVKILRMILKIKPSIVIVTTHELLFAGVIAKVLLRCKLVYDVQENYFLNIMHTDAFPTILKFPVAWYVRMQERLFSSAVNHFFIAEKIYANQLSFLKDKFTILENKARTTNSLRAGRSGRNLVFSGTLARSTGVFRAIDIVKQLHALDQTISLTIIGYAPLKSERDALNNAIRDLPFVALIGGDKLVNHSQILEVINQACAGIIAYEENLASTGRVPTKLYEYLEAGLPIIFAGHDRTWSELAAAANSDVFQIMGENNPTREILSWLENPSARGTSPSWISWKSEEIKLQTTISALQ